MKLEEEYNVESKERAIGIIANELCGMRSDRHSLRSYDRDRLEELKELAEKWDIPFSYDLCISIMDNMYEQADWDSSSEYCGF